MSTPLRVSCSTIELPVQGYILEFYTGQTILSNRGKKLPTSIRAFFLPQRGHQFVRYFARARQISRFE
jgi:hypothetical protein